MEIVEIYTSKKKMFLALLGSVVFVGLGIWFLINPPQISNPVFGNPIMIFIIGLASILFFGFGIFVSIKRLIKSEIALIVSAEGINVNPSKSPTETIKWSDIQGFEEIKIHGTRILIIGVKKPEYWLEKETSKFRRKLMQFNIDNYNSPFNIAAAGLDISSTELNKILNTYFEKYKNEL